jgi:hypothetical protein
MTAWISWPLLPVTKIHMANGEDLKIDTAN